MARISLHPADLGGVRITMRVHDGTVAATLAAETPAAAQALAQTASDLRRSLEGQGLQSPRSTSTSPATAPPRAVTAGRRPTSGTR